jgi:hypothetical protein
MSTKIAVKKSEADPKNPRGIPTADYIVRASPACRTLTPHPASGAFKRIARRWDNANSSC